MAQLHMPARIICCQQQISQLTLIIDNLIKIIIFCSLKTSHGDELHRNYGYLID